MSSQPLDIRHKIQDTAVIHKNDFQTPMNVCSYMVSLLPNGIEHVLEPTPGIGNLKKTLERNGFLVTGPEDFFLLKKQRFDAVCMNPPFSSKYAFLENAPESVTERGMRLGYYILKQCMEMSDHVIALMPWFTISDSDVRLRFLKDYGLRSITALPRKTFQYARIQTMVLELEKGFQGQTEFIVFDKLTTQRSLFNTTQGKEAPNV